MFKYLNSGKSGEVAKKLEAIKTNLLCLLVEYNLLTINSINQCGLPRAKIAVSIEFSAIKTY